MRKKYEVSLDGEERAELERLVRSGVSAARKLNHARILLRADDGDVDAEVAEAVGVGEATVYRVRRRFAEEGLAAALGRRPQPPRPQKRKLDGDGEAHLVALACSAPPDGHPEWTLRLLADRMVELRYAQRGVSYETVRRCLKKTRLSRG
jgi:transposase